MPAPPGHRKCTNCIKSIRSAPNWVFIVVRNEVQRHRLGAVYSASGDAACSFRFIGSSLFRRRQDLPTDSAVGILSRPDLGIPVAGDDFGRLFLGERHAVPDRIVIDRDVDGRDLLGVFAGVGRPVHIAHRDRAAQPHQVQAIFQHLGRGPVARLEIPAAAALGRRHFVGAVEGGPQVGLRHPGLAQVERTARQEQGGQNRSGADDGGDHELAALPFSIIRSLLAGSPLSKTPSPPMLSRLASPGGRGADVSVSARRGWQGGPGGGMIVVQRSAPMKYDVISADGHVDLIWLPPDLFTRSASASLKDRMPHVIEGPKGPEWVSAKGAKFGLVNGMGSAGREYVPGVIHRSDRMASTGLYDDGKKGIRRLTEPPLRLKDQDRDGVQAEVLYGVLGSSGRLNDPEAALEMLRIYNDWLHDFCRATPDRLVGLSNIPNYNMEESVAEMMRNAKRGVRGFDVANRPDMTPLWDPFWEPLWQCAHETGIPVHFHTIGGRSPDYSKMPQYVVRRVQATHITSFQMHMGYMLMSLIFSGALERYPNLKIVIGEAGLGWIPYVLQHMDLEWEDQFKDLDLKMKPSEYWHRQCYATYQTDPVGIRLLDVLGEDNVMWGSDYPHPDGIWPDSQEFLDRELSGVSAEARRKVTRDNAMKLYRLGN